MRKVRIWVDTGFCNAMHEDILNLKMMLQMKKLKMKQKSFCLIA